MRPWVAGALGLSLLASTSESCFFGLKDLKTTDAGVNGGKSGDASLSDGTFGGGTGGKGGSGGKGGTSTGGSAGSANGGSAGSVACTDPTTGDCDGDPSNGCETDLTSDGSHCGSCGHDCLGGNCASSKCQPVLLISHDSDDKIVAPYNLAIDTNSIYFTVHAYSAGQGYVMKIPLGGATTATVLAGGEDFPWDIALDGSSVYWTDADSAFAGGSVRSIPKSGGSAQVLAPNEVQATGVSVDDSSVYWAIHSSSGTIRTVSKGGGTVTTLVGNQGGSFGTVADPGTSGSVYFTTDADGQVRKVSKGGSSATDLAPTNSPRQIATDGSDLFFAEFRAGGDVSRVDKFGNNGTALASGQDSPYGVAVDNDYVYFTLHGASAGAGGVARVLKAGGSVETLATGMNQPTGIAVDDVAIYWIESDAFNIWKLAK